MKSKERVAFFVLMLILCLQLLPTNAFAEGGFIIKGGILTRYIGSERDVVIPNEVTEIGDWAFNKCTNIQSIIIPNGVNKIGYYAFSDCSSLTSIKIPDSVTYIDAGAFCLCRNLTDIKIPSNVTFIGTYAFEDCSSLTEITIPDSVTDLGYGVFDNSGITSFTFPENLASCEGSYLFKNCTSLTKVVFPTSGETVKTFRNWAAGYFGACFEGCSSLKEVVNIPCAAYAKRLADNQALIGWLNPGECITLRNERFVKLANEITAGLDSDYQKAEAIVHWVHTNIEYDFNAPSNEAERVLENRRGVCEGFARLTEALLDAADIPSICVMGRIEQKNHMWNYIFADDRWIWADPTAGMEYFDASIFYLSADRIITAFLYSADAHTPSKWAQDEIWDAILTKVAPYDLQTFYHKNITRSEFCRLMINLIEKAAGQSIDVFLAERGLNTTPNFFTDTNDASILAAHALGIVNGKSKTIFDPEGTITRQAVAAMLSRTAGILGVEAGSGEMFHDSQEFPSWTREYIDFVSGLVDPISNKKVMGGTSDGNFNPLVACTKEQAIVIALRLYHCVV